MPPLQHLLDRFQLVANRLWTVFGKAAAPFSLRNDTDNALTFEEVLVLFQQADRYPVGLNYSLAYRVRHELLQIAVVIQRSGPPSPALQRLQVSFFELAKFQSRRRRPVLAGSKPDILLFGLCDGRLLVGGLQGRAKLLAINAILDIPVG